VNAAAVEAASGGWFDPPDATPTIDVALLRVLEDDAPGSPLAATAAPPHAERPSAPPGAPPGPIPADARDAPHTPPHAPSSPSPSVPPGILNLMTMIRDAEQ